MPRPAYPFDVATNNRVLATLSTESERAMVLLGAAWLDDLLYHVLQRALIPEPRRDDSLLDPERPLGTFSARIDLVYRLGLIDAPFARALHLVRRIRNDFAHETSAANLESGPQGNRVAELLSLMKQYRTEPFWRTFAEPFAQKSVAAREFAATLAVLFLRLDDCASGVTPQSHPLVTLVLPNTASPSTE